MPGKPVPWTVTAFQKNRRATWKAVRWWIALLAVGVIGFSVPFFLEWEHVSRSGLQFSLSFHDMTAREFTLSLVSLVACITAFMGIFLGVRRHFQCPQCRSILIESSIQVGPFEFSKTEGRELNPSKCMKCGAQLS